MSAPVQSNLRALVESVARVLPASARDDFRNLMNQGVVDNLTALSPGGNLLQPGGAQSGSSAPPEGVTHTVAGANGTYTVQINSGTGTRPIYHEISYAPTVSFTQGVTTLPVTTGSSVSIPAPGNSAVFRLRSSYDQKTWSSYQMASTQPVSAGLVESSAISAGGAFNQTNYAVVSSSSTGAGDVVNIHGTGGQFSSYTAVKGGVQSLRPSATLFGLVQQSKQFVAWDGSQYQLQPNLASALADHLEPVGLVTVGSATPGGGTATGGNGGRLTAV